MLIIQQSKAATIGRAATKAVPVAKSLSSSTANNSLHHFKFEIHGKVQGVFFRNHTEKEAKRLGLTGYVLNTEHKTVLGEACGPPNKMAEFKRWLSTKGSPKSRITKAVFTEEGPALAGSCNFSGFVVRRYPEKSPAHK